MEKQGGQNIDQIYLVVESSSSLRKYLKVELVCNQTRVVDFQTTMQPTGIQISGF